MIAFKPLLSATRSLLRSRVVSPFIANGTVFQSPSSNFILPLPPSIPSNGSKKCYSSTAIIAAAAAEQVIGRRGKKVLDGLRITLDLTDADVDRLIKRIPQLENAMVMNTAAPAMNFLKTRLSLSTGALQTPVSSQVWIARDE